MVIDDFMSRFIALKGFPHRMKSFPYFSRFRRFIITVRRALALVYLIRDAENTSKISKNDSLVSRKAIH